MRRKMTGDRMVEKCVSYIVSNRIPYAEALDLWERSGAPDAFSHPNCWRAIEESGVHQGVLRCVEVRAGGGRLMAVWPFRIVRGRARDMFARIAEPLGAHYMDYVAPLFDQEATGPALDCLMEGVSKVLHNTGMIRLNKLVVGSAHGIKCEEMGASSFRMSRCVSPSPRIRVADTYEQTELALGWGRKHRPSTQLRRMEKQGQLQFRVAETRGEILERLPVLFDLHRAKWGAVGQESQFNYESERTCFRMFAELLPLEILHYSEVRLNDDVLSCHFGFVCNNWAYWFKPAYNPEFQKVSPGMVHIALMAQQCIDRGWHGIDFLQGDEQYKYRWANDTNEVNEFIVTTLRGFPWWLWETGLREKTRQACHRARSGLVGH